MSAWICAKLVSFIVFLGVGAPSSHRGEALRFGDWSEGPEPQ